MSTNVNVYFIVIGTALKSRINTIIRYVLNPQLESAVNLSVINLDITKVW